MMILRNVKQKFESELLHNYTKKEAESLFFIFLEEVTSISRAGYLLQSESRLRGKEISELRGILDRLKKGEAYQHIIGEVEFAGLKLKVNKNALIPRPETEELAYIIFEENKGKAQHKIIDIGTGTGCLALACAKFFPGPEVTALDISEKAIDLGRENARKNQLDINFICIDFLKEENWPLQKWDLIISNPPYIGNSESQGMDDIVLNNEPATALFVPDDNPLLFYKALLRFANKNLTTGGVLYLEINEKLGEETLGIFLNGGYRASLIKDLSGKDRFVKAIK